MENNKAIITQDILRNKAGELWKALPQYAGVEEPKWSNGWIGGFQKRFKIKEYVPIPI
jgi:Tc5 transposase-like DNA-binding protein